MSSKKRLKIGSHTSKLLVRLGDNAIDMVECLQYPSIAAFNGVEGVRRFKRSQILSDERYAIRRLRDKKYIEVQKMGDAFMYKFSKKGFDEYLYQRLMQFNPLPEGYSCFVLFDIPEDRRDVRQQLRRLLKAIGFFQIQKSVWASPFDFAEDLSRFLAFKGRRKWVLIYTVKEPEFFKNKEIQQ